MTWLYYLETQDTARNAVDKKIGTIKLTAGENDTTVSAIVVERLGLWEVDEIDSVQLMHNNEYVAENNTFRNEKATVRFSPSLKLKANSSMEFDVLVSLSATWAGSTHKFKVVDVVVANGKSSGTPVELGTLNVANYMVKSMSISSLSVGTIETGKRGEVASLTFKPETGSPVTVVDWITFTAPENAELTKKLSNVKAYLGNDEVGTVTLKDESIIVKWLNLERTSTQSTTIKLKADGIFVGNQRTWVLSVKTWHLYAIEKTTKERMSSNLKTGTLTIDWVDLSIENLTTKTQNYALWDSEIELLNLKITSSVEFDITDYTLSGTLSWIDLNNVLEDVYLYINGVDYPVNSDVEKFAANKHHFTVKPNAPIYVKVLANVVDTFTWTANFKFNFKVNKIKNVEEKEVVPLTADNDKDWHTSKISKWTTTLSKRTVSASSTIKEGSVADVMLFDLEANAEDQILSGVSFKFFWDSALSWDSALALSGLVKELRLFVDGSNTPLKTLKGDDIVSIVSGDEVAFVDLSKTLEKDKVTKFTLKALLEDSEVKALGKKIRFVVDSDGIETVRKADDSVITDIKGVSTITWTLYTIASDTPTVELTVAWTKVTVEITNPSAYDIELTGLNFSVLKSIVNSQIADWSGTAKLLDVAEEEASNVTPAPAIPSNSVTFSWLNTYEITAHGSLIYILEVEWTNVQLTPDYFTAAIKYIEFLYVDGDDPSDLIKETY